MAHMTLRVIDDFYEDPDEIRKLALAQRFERNADATYPGRQAIADYDWTVVRERLRKYIDERVDAPSPKPYAVPQGLFRLALAEDEKLRIDGVHQDAQRWSVVIYMSLPQHCAGGVAFFRHRETGLTSSTREMETALFGHIIGSQSEMRERVLAYLRDQTQWEEIGRVPMAYNRAVLLMAQCFHMSVGIFGDRPENGRLTQHFEFYSDADGLVYANN